MANSREAKSKVEANNDATAGFGSMQFEAF